MDSTPSLALILALVVNDGYSAWALAGWQVVYLLLGLALALRDAVPASVKAAAEHDSSIIDGLNVENAVAGVAGTLFVEP